VYICLSVCLSICLPVYLSTYLPIYHLSLCLSTCLSLCLISLSVNLSICLSLCLISLSVCLSVYLSAYLSDLIYLHTALCWRLAAFSVSSSFTQSVGLLGRGISQSQGRYLHTGQHKNKINAHRHPCLEWDWNPRSQCLSRQRLFIP
jgi:hypothetical protein